MATATAVAKDALKMILRCFIVGSAIVIVCYCAMKQTQTDRYSTKTLPYPLNDFVARETELTNLTEQLSFNQNRSTARVLSIIGSPGFGKSTLAIQLGHKLIEQNVFVRYINMAEVLERNVKVVLAEKMLEKKKHVSFDKLLTKVREGQNTVFIFDNCDEILNKQEKRFQQVIKKILEASSTVKIVTTSREFTLYLENYSWYKVTELSDEGALLLLNKKLSQLTSVTTEEKEKIAELTGNVPLALQIVGSLLLQPHPPSIATVIEELEQNPVNFLSSQKIPSEDRLNVSISLSYKHLDTIQRKAGYLLSLFPGSFTKATAVDVCFRYKNITDICNLLDDTFQTLVDRSLLEYNKRSERYQYHRLIREYFITKENTQISTEFMAGFRYHFLNKLYSHTIVFKTEHIKSLKFMDAERHNFHKLLKELKDPNKLSQRSLLLSIDSITHSLNVGYLSCRFTPKELKSVLKSVVEYLDNNLVSFLQRAATKEIEDLHGTKWTQKEFYQRTYVELIIIYSELLHKKAASEFMEKRKGMVDYVTNQAKMYSSKDSGITDPKTSPETIVFSVKSRYYSYYKSLANLYFSLHDHSRAIQCHLMIAKGTEDCEEGQCLYKDVAYIYWDVRNYAEAANFFELSFEHDLNNDFSKAGILVKLASSYKFIEGNNWWFKTNEQGAIDRLKAAYIQIVKMEDDTVFINNWEAIIESITLLQKGGIDAEFIKDRVFSVISAPESKLQLQPKDVLKCLEIVKENKSQTVEWGSILMKPFENYDNFSSSAERDILSIRLKMSVALLSINRTEGIQGIENVYKQILDMYNDEAHKEKLINLHSQTCSSLILSTKSLQIISKYIYPCYKDSVVTIIRFLRTVYFYKFPTIFPKHLVYAIFVIPLGRYTSSNAREEILETIKPVKSRGNDMILIKGNEIMNIESIQLNFFDNSWYQCSMNFLQILQNDIIRIIINVASILLRVWIFLTLLFTYLGITLYYLSIFPAFIMEAKFLYACEDKCHKIRFKVIIGLSNMLIFVTKLLVWSLENSWGSVWLILYALLSPHNLAQIHSDYYVQLYRSNSYINRLFYRFYYHWVCKIVAFVAYFAYFDNIIIPNSIFMVLIFSPLIATPIVWYVTLPIFISSSNYHYVQLFYE